MSKNLCFLAISLMLAACDGKAATVQAGGALASCDTRAYTEIGGPISLTDSTGKRVTEDTFRGRASLVYFGFTYCPDVCPATLVTIERALRRLPNDIQPPRTILISLDPERDTPASMASYIATDVFPDDMVGLTGTPDEIKAAADAFKIAYERIEVTENTAEYTIDHSSILYLMDENWSLKTFFTYEADPQSISDCLALQLPKRH